MWQSAENLYWCYNHEGSLWNAIEILNQEMKTWNGKKKLRKSNEKNLDVSHIKAKTKKNNQNSLCSSDRWTVSVDNLDRNFWKLAIFIKRREQLYDAQEEGFQM